MGEKDRLVLSDTAWEPIRLRPDQKGSTGRDNRMFVEGVLWIGRRSTSGDQASDAANVERLPQYA